LEYLQLGQVLVNGSSRLPYTYCKMKCARLSGAGFSSVQVVQRPASCNSQEVSIQAEKKPRGRLLSSTEEKLEECNLFRIRKFSDDCTITCSKTSNKVNRNGKNPEFRKK
jgi:hypothetical protein